MIFSKKIEALYRKAMFSRQEKSEAVFFFTPSDFPGLNDEPYSFTSSKGHTLAGHLYSYPSPTEDKIIIFDHGMGAGHLAYMKEIELLARHGYLVFAYDHTGCASSGGEGTGGFGQSVRDLDDCITAIKGDARFNGRRIAVVGHSWGAFSTMNIVRLHRDVTHIVAIAGLISLKQILKQNFPGPLGLYKKRLTEIERESNPNHYSLDAIESLKDSQVKALLIYSENDTFVKKAFHYDLLAESLKDSQNVRLMLVEGKGHNPNYTKNAVRVKDEYFALLQKKLKEGALNDTEAQRKFASEFDFDAMTEQDEAVWDEILKHLES